MLYYLLVTAGETSKRAENVVIWKALLNEASCEVRIMGLACHLTQGMNGIVVLAVLMHEI